MTTRVAHLMTSICKPESVLHTYDPKYFSFLALRRCVTDWFRNLYLLNHRQEATISKAIGRWDFSAHDFSEEELVHAAFLMLQHALQMPDLEKWRIPAGKQRLLHMQTRPLLPGTEI